MTFFRFANAPIAAVALMLAALPGLSWAQQPTKTDTPEPSAVLSPAQADAAFQAIVAELDRSYVFPEKLPTIRAALHQAKAAGRYDVDTPSVFAERITEDMKAASADGHLYLYYAPAESAAAKTSRAEGPKPGDALDTFLRAQAARDHHGLSDARLLAGNLRYLRITGFEWIEDETGAVYDDAMRFLRDADAIIIDIRGNGGGSHAAVRYLTSHFMDSDQLLFTFLKPGEPPKQSHTLEHLPAGRMKGKPLYVLIDGGVASAGEDFAYQVSQFRLGELVGERTAGSANNNLLVPVDPGFMLSVSYGRPVHAVSGGNWQGTGIAPTVPAESSTALDVAQSLALKRLATRPDATPRQRAEYAWAQIGLEARRHPPAVTVARLKTLAGRYGQATVTFKNDALWLSTRPGGPTRRMTPLTEDGLFAIEGNEMLRARFTSAGLETLWRGDPNPRRFPKK
ncbi:S41 family peptidase [Stigmatella aurantiaca]|nr:S41 family peptidase [Stigmatella aurantiaca]ADO72911.1 Peptidase, S41 domain protein [Stigmatella aurantiaca DW4/3-1]